MCPQMRKRHQRIRPAARTLKFHEAVAYAQIGYSHRQEPIEEDVKKRKTKMMTFLQPRSVLKSGVSTL